ncbi:MAG: hypothetical protein ACYC7E_13365 [Armatimonadota bacterium]
MRHAILLLIFILTLTAANMAVGADLFQQVPASDPAYKQILALNRYGLVLADQKSRLTGVPAIRLLTRYDFAFLLIEPLERLCALQDALTNTTVLAPEQVRRRDLAALAVSSLTHKDFITLLDDTEKLLANFAGEVEELALSPSLAGRAKDALRKLRTASSRALPGGESSDGSRNKMYFSFVPRSPVTSFSSTPLSSTAAATERTISPFTPLGTDPGGMSIRSVTTMDTAIQLLFDNYQVSFSLKSQPGEDLIQLIKNGGKGTAKVELWYEVGRMNDLGINVFLNYQVQRSTGELGETEVNTFNTIGVGLRW